jgi:hypothetical protein
MEIGGNFSLKGCKNPAQGNALGNKVPQPKALKGRKNVEGSPKELAIEEHKGHLARVLFGSRKMTGTPKGHPVKYHPRGQKMYDLLGESKGKLNAAKLKDLLSHKSICACDATNEPRQVRSIDAMLFDTTTREALVTRGPIGSRPWTRFGFDQD